jgi:zinc-binding alcohol dehydrogenase family protein
MKAVAYQHPLPIDQPESLQDIELAAPVASGHDLLVSVRAVSVNPVDTKVRRSSAPPEGQWKVLGYDAAGVVEAVGEQVTLFKPGDRVWYAGDIGRQGSNAELQLVDERIVGRMPVTLGFAAAAALPLTAITAWELLFDRLQIHRHMHHEAKESDDTLLIVGAGGGVGSILTQLARRCTALTVIGTASRPQTTAWVTELGAHHVIDHSKALSEELKRIGLPQVRHVIGLTETERHFDQIVESLAPQGQFALIDDPETLDVAKLKRKSISLHWEFMFTRSMFQTADMEAQHHLLNEVAKLVDEGVLRTTLADTLGTINAVNLKRAHALIERGSARGKLVLEGF